ncbi:hypothetical protein FQZ97_1110340 [compost metagenome]
MVAHQFGAVDHFAGRVSEALAGLQCQRSADALGPALQHSRKPAQGVSTLNGRQGAPGALRLHRGFDRSCRLFVCCRRYRRENLTGCRIADVD